MFYNLEARKDTNRPAQLGRQPESFDRFDRRSDKVRIFFIFDDNSKIFFVIIP